MKVICNVLHADSQKGERNLCDEGDAWVVIESWQSISYRQEPVTGSTYLCKDPSHTYSLFEGIVDEADYGAKGKDVQLTQEDASWGRLTRQWEPRFPVFYISATDERRPGLKELPPPFFNFSLIKGIDADIIATPRPIILDIQRTSGKKITKSQEKTIHLNLNYLKPAISFALRRLAAKREETKIPYQLLIITKVTHGKLVLSHWLIFFR